MARAAALLSNELLFDEAPSVEAQIRAFLDGDSNGEPLLRALYDHVLEEPIPARLLEALRG